MHVQDPCSCFSIIHQMSKYIAYLMTVDELSFVDEIDCRDLFPGDDPRERIVVFEIL